MNGHQEWVPNYWSRHRKLHFLYLCIQKRCCVNDVLVCVPSLKNVEM